MRVTLVATSMHRTSAGGETFLRGLMSGLAQVDGLRLRVITTGPAPPLDSLAAGGRIEFAIVRGHAGLGRLVSDAGLVAAISAKSTDVIHYPHEWCPPSRLPVVMTVQNIGPFHPSTASALGFRGKGLRALARTTARRAAARVAVSKLAANVWDDAVPTAPTTHVVPEGFIGEAEGSPIVHALNSDNFVLAVCGSAAYKNATLTIEAMTRFTTVHPGVTWVVAGVVPGEWHDGVRHIGVGHVARAELLNLMAAARCVVFLSSVESFGLPALEAVHQGTPVVVLEGTAMAEWLQDACNPVRAEPQAIVEAVASVLSRPVGSPALRAGSQFSWQTIAEAYVEIYSAVTAAARNE